MQNVQIVEEEATPSKNVGNKEEAKKDNNHDLTLFDATSARNLDVMHQGAQRTIDKPMHTPHAKT